MVWLGDKIEVAIELCDEEIERRKDWLERGDYTDREYAPILRDIKRFKSMKKRLEGLLNTYKELETY